MKINNQTNEFLHFLFTNESYEFDENMEVTRIKDFVENKVKDFFTISICDLMSYFEFYENVNTLSLSWIDETRLVFNFCKKYNVYLYEKPRENFNRSEGISYAIAHGYKAIILSDLS